MISKDGTCYRAGSSVLGVKNNSAGVKTVTSKCNSREKRLTGETEQTSATRHNSGN